MSATFPTVRDCCQPCDSVPINQVPGPAGADGTNGTNGTDGIDAFSITTAAFTMPAVNATVNVAVAQSTWASVGQYVFIESAGTFQVTAVPNSTHVTLKNLGYPDNVAPTTLVPSAGKVSPGGRKGTDGIGALSTLNDISPTTTRGDLIVDNGANSPAASDVRLGIGSDGTTLHADSAQPTGMKWAKVNLASASEITGVLPTANGGNADRVAKAGDTMTGGLHITLASAFLALLDSAGAANQKKWQIVAEAGLLKFESVDDTNTIFRTFLQISRSGVSPVAVTVNYDLVAGTSLEIAQLFALNQLINTTLAAGDNNNVGFTKTYVKLKAGPGGAFAITGIDINAVLGFTLDGRVLVLQNSTGQTMTLKHENASSVISNRIHSSTGADVACNLAILVYDTDAQRWEIITAL
jgi:hypothetical protein